MSSYKRKRLHGEDFGVGRRGSQVYAPMRRTYKRRKLVVPGYTRKVGYYGRFAGRPPSSELKFLDTSANDAIVAATGDFIGTGTVVVIPQDTTESGRIGRKCTIKQIHWRYKVSLAERDAVADPVEGDSLRMILYQDKQCNGATAATGDILETASFLSFRNLVNTGRFVMLMDKIVNINYAGLGSDGAGVVSQAEVVKSYEWHKSCNIPIEYSSTTGAIAEIKSNNIGIFLISTSGIVRFDSNIRVRFSDM